MIAAEYANLAIGEIFSLQFVDGQKLPARERALETLRRGRIRDIGYIEGGPIDEPIDSLFLGKRRVTLRRGIRFDKLVVARPERELALDILGFRNIDRGIPRTFGLLVGQIKRQDGRCSIVVPDDENFGAELLF